MVENLSVVADDLIHCFARYVMFNRFEFSRTICERHWIDSSRSFRIMRRRTSKLVVFRPCSRSGKRARLRCLMSLRTIAYT